MDPRKSLFLIIAFGLGAAALMYYSFGPVQFHFSTKPPEGALAEILTAREKARQAEAPYCAEPISYEPYQAEAENIDTITRNGFDIKRTHDFEIRGRVVSVQRYAEEDDSADEASAISPMDVVMVWDQLDSAEVIKNFSIAHRARMYNYLYDKVFIPDCVIRRSIGIFHLIPNDEAVAERLKSIRENQRIHLTGKLADIRQIGGDLRWRSSKRRDDSGSGSSEIIYVMDAGAY